MRESLDDEQLSDDELDELDDEEPEQLGISSWILSMISSSVAMILPLIMQSISFLNGWHGSSAKYKTGKSSRIVARIWQIPSRIEALFFLLPRAKMFATR